MSEEADGPILPFVCVQSVGGPYDDESFAAGWSCGEVGAMLIQRPVSLEVTVRVATLKQLDLLAMHHGYVMEPCEPSEIEEWCHAMFTPMRPIA
jgi:hypothetical protein